MAKEPKGDNMRKVLVVATVVMLVAGMAMAQGYGMQVGESAAAAAQGAIRVSAGANVGGDMMFYGARAAYAPVQGLQVFVQGGLADSDDLDSSATSIGGGAMYALPLQMPVDLAVRGAIDKPLFDDIEIPTYDYYGYSVGGGTMSVDVLVMSALALASKSLDQVAGLTVYAGVGFARVSVSVGDVDESDTNLELVGGAIYNVTEQLSVFGEVDYVDDPFFGGGVRFDI